MTERFPRRRDVELDTTHLESALAQAAQVYGGDAALLRRVSHGAEVSEGGLFVPPKFGTFSVRIPTDISHDAKLLSEALSLTTLCVDPRQVGQSVDWLKLNVSESSQADAVLAIAAGAGQIEADRSHTLVNLHIEAFKVNPNIIAHCVVHDEGCKGVEIHSGGVPSTLLRGDPARKKNDEAKHMMGLLFESASKLINAGFPRKQIRLHIAHIGQDNRFSKLLTLKAR